MPTSRFSPVKDQQVIVVCDSAAITAGDISGVLSALKSFTSDHSFAINKCRPHGSLDLLLGRQG